MGIRIFAVCLASFALGFNLCNVIYIFLSPYSKRNNRNNETSSANEESEGGDNF